MASEPIINIVNVKRGAHTFVAVYPPGEKNERKIREVFTRWSKLPEFELKFTWFEMAHLNRQMRELRKE